ncbi:inner membrane protein [Kushneria avicenniae]|uniref:Inner membrane protein n=1 Tax=Kushneria avicenniae TaxID=402385 RepID=A0A1I1L3M2_9GAMM|nr:metal-dependent hydrolase [Kushneria avicenniae]SFC67624.1 inner membrane protein [Kushneria avicenniae]
MDSLTQACLGGALGGAILGRRLGRKSILLGAVTATLPDLDSFIDYGSAVADYTYHRSVTHSLFALSLLAGMFTLVCARLPAARKVPTRQWLCFWWLCLITHPLLDAFTTYGTQLLWPITSPPVAWKTIFIIDPLYTLPMLLGLVVALIKGTQGRAVIIGLAISTAYLGFSIAAKSMVMAQVSPALVQRGLDDRPVMIQPTPLNTLVWRVTVIDDDRQLEALVSIFDDRDTLAFDSFQRPMAFRDLMIDSWAGQRLGWFSAPFWRSEVRDGTLVVTDLRMGQPGAYFFAFVIAERDDSGQWHSVTSRPADIARPDIGLLPALLKRITNPDALCPSDFGDRDRLLPDAECRPQI